MAIAAAVALALPAVGVGVILPAAAVAQAPGNPLSPGLPQPSGTVPTTSTPPVTALPTTSTAGSSGISGSGVVVIAIGALVVLGGISFFIWRDARRRAPVRSHAAAAEPGGRSGSKPRGKPRKLSPAERRRRKRGRAR